MSNSVAPPSTAADNKNDNLDGSDHPRVHYVPGTPKRREESSVDDCSNITDDRSLVSRVSTKLGTVLGQAGKILIGELPPDVYEDDDEDRYGIRHSRSPLGLEDPKERSSSLGSSSHKGDQIDFLQDPPSTMTYSRRLAMKWCQKGWYNPRANQEPQFSDAQLEAPGASMKKGGTASVGSTTTASKSPNNSNAPTNNIMSEEKKTEASIEAYPFTHSRRENPSIEKAWAYFDHVSMPRYVVEPKPPAPQKSIFRRIIRKFSKANKQMDRAEPGEKYLKTALYSPIFTPHKQLGDWGLGFGLYFSTLRALAILTFLAGIMNIPNFIYFSSDSYSDGQTQVPDLIRGSAVCTRTQWVPCESCLNHTDKFPNYRIAAGRHVDTGLEATFVLQNQCDGATLQQGFVNYMSLIFLIVGIFFLNRYLEKMEVAFDEDEQTAQDYSIVISNPPGDATDPEEWRTFFFERFGGSVVTALTIAVDNDFLVRSLVERRETLRKIEMTVEPGTSLDSLTLAGIATKEEHERNFFGRLMAKVSPGIPELFARLVVLTAKVQGLAQQDYPVTNLFVTFETEAAQRYVLSKLSIGSIHAKNNRKSALDPQFLFRDEYVLSADEPGEPNTIRWQDLNEKFKDRLKQQSLTALCTCAAVALIAFIVNMVSLNQPALTAISIAVFNSIFPTCAKMLTDTEAHSSEGGKQRSLYFKIALFRWVNTAIVITLITPFSETIRNGRLIQQVYALFFAEIVTTNAIQLLDPVGHLQRHFLAPRATTQDAMNMNMQGQQVELAERYTNMTKILFLALWYCAVFPGAYFMCSFALIINYFTDRFSLMRTWKRAPNLGSETSAFSRRYFFSLALVAMAVVSSYYWAAFPFDNVCATEMAVGEEMVGRWNLQTKDFLMGTLQEGDVGRTSDAVREGDVQHFFCEQDFFRYDPFERKFPFVPQHQREGAEWMTEEQETVTAVYGWTSVAAICLLCLKFAHGWFASFMGLFRGTYDPCGDDQNINFSDVATMSAYVPQIESKVFAYPLLACNFDNVDEDLLDWADPDRPIIFYDLTKDADVLLRSTDVSAKVVFSQIFHWPPQPVEN